MVAPCPAYQHFPEPEHAEFFQNTLNNVLTISQLSKLWEYPRSTGSFDYNVPHQQTLSIFWISQRKWPASVWATPLWLYLEYTESCDHNVLGWHIFCIFMIHWGHVIKFYLGGSKKMHSVWPESTESGKLKTHVEYILNILNKLSIF